MKKLIWLQFVVLAVGVIFAWTNFAIELRTYLRGVINPYVCTQGVVNPFLTPCFYGALVFTGAFTVSLLMVIKMSRQGSR
jgi:hypothetical protein